MLDVVKIAASPTLPTTFPTNATASVMPATRETNTADFQSPPECRSGARPPGRTSQSNPAAPTPLTSNSNNRSSNESSMDNS